jgi:hypothetical protein
MTPAGAVQSTAEQIALELERLRTQAEATGLAMLAYLLDLAIIEARERLTGECLIER